MSAEKGWIADPPSPRPDPVPGQEHKWHLMMGAAQSCPRCRELVDKPQN